MINMDIYKIIASNILYYINLLEKDEEFKKQNPDITVIEYLLTITEIKPKRLSNILNEPSKTRIPEIYRIAIALNIKVENLLKRDND